MTCDTELAITTQPLRMRRRTSAQEMSAGKQRSIECWQPLPLVSVASRYSSTMRAFYIGTAEQISEAQWDETFATNVRGVWLLSRAVLPYMRKAGGGSIVNVASVLGINGARNRASYAPSKGAMILLTKCMAIDHGAENIRVNAICPSFIETDLTAEVIRKAPDPGAVRRERIGVHPIGRLGQPDDIAGLAVYLASDESSWVTGAAMPVDGGYLAV